MSTKPFRIEDVTSGTLVSFGGYADTPYIVGQDGESPYTNINSAIGAAVAAYDLDLKAKVVYVKPGTYIEDLTFYPNIAVIGSKPFASDISKFINGNSPLPAGKVALINGTKIEGFHNFSGRYGTYIIENILFIPNMSSENWERALLDIEATDPDSKFEINNCYFYNSATLQGESGYGGNTGSPLIHFRNPNSTSRDRYSFNNCLFYSDTNLDDTSIFYFAGGERRELNLNRCVFYNPVANGSVCVNFDDVNDEYDKSVNAKDCIFYNINIKIAETYGSISVCFRDSYLYNEVSDLFTVSNPVTLEIINCEINVTGGGKVTTGAVPTYFDTTGTIYRNGNSDTNFYLVDKVYKNISNPRTSYFSYISGDTQTADAINTPQAISVSDYLNFRYRAIVLPNSEDPPRYTKIKFQEIGVYNLQFSLQLDRTSGSGTDTVDIFLRKNGDTSIPYSNTKVTVSGSANNAKMVPAWNFFINHVDENDYYELMWTTTNTNILLLAEAANGIHPETPSVILTANKIYS